MERHTKNRLVEETTKSKTKQQSLAEAVLASTTMHVLSRKKKNNVYPCKPKFYYIKEEFNVSKLYWYVFVMITHADNKDLFELT